jgi:hypothetical protein
VEVGFGYVFAGFVGDGHVACAEHDRFASEGGEVGGFGAEGYGGGLVAAERREQIDDALGGGGFEGGIAAQNGELGGEIGELRADEVGDGFGMLAGDGPPFDGEAAFAGNDVLGCAAFDQAYVDGGEWRIESIVAVELFEVFGQLFDSDKDAGGVVDGGPSHRRESAVRFRAVNDD